MLRHRVRSGGATDDEPGGRGRVDDMALRILCKHQRREHFDPMDHAP